MLLDLDAILDPDRPRRHRRPHDSLPDQLPPEWHVVWDERAAVMEYDGGLPRERAEALALTETLALMRATN